MTSFRLSDPASPEITVENDPLRGPRVLADGKPVERRRDGARPMWPIPMHDGTERRLFVAGQFIGLRAVVDGQQFPIERRLEPWELVLAVVPIGLVTYLVGAAGILTGGTVTGLSFGLFRRPWPAIGRIVAWLGLVAIAILIGVVLARASG